MLANILSDIFKMNYLLSYLDNLKVIFVDHYELR